MKAPTPPYYLQPSLTERAMQKLKLSYKSASVLLCLLFGGILIAALGADGLLEQTKSKPGEGMSTAAIYIIQMPLLIAYTFFMFGYLRKWLNRMICAIRPLVDLDDDEFQALLTQQHKRNKRTQLLFTSIYTLLCMTVLTTWTDKYPALSAFWLLCAGTMSLLVGQLIATIPLFGRQLLRALLAEARSYNVFHPGPLHSIAHFSLRVTVAFIGAIVLGEIFVPAKDILDPLHLAVNGGFVLFALGLHIFMIYQAHLFMVRHKRQELAFVRTQLKLFYDDLRMRFGGGEPFIEPIDSFDGGIEPLLVFEERLKSAPEWPQNSAIVRRLIFTILLPTAIGMAKKSLFKLLPSG